MFADRTNAISGYQRMQSRVFSDSHNRGAWGESESHQPIFPQPARSDQDERLPPLGPERSQRNPKQLVQGSQSRARSLRVQSQQLLMKS